MPGIQGDPPNPLSCFPLLQGHSHISCMPGTVRRWNYPPPLCIGRTLVLSFLADIYNAFLKKKRKSYELEKCRFAGSEIVYGRTFICRGGNVNKKVPVGCPECSVWNGWEAAGCPWHPLRSWAEPAPCSSPSEKRTGQAISTLKEVSPRRRGTEVKGICWSS